VGRSRDDEEETKEWKEKGAGESEQMMEGEGRGIKEIGSE